MEQTWLVLLPPLIVLITAIFTKKLTSGLFVGLCSGALIATQYNIIASAQLLAIRLVNQVTEPDNIYMYLFLFLIAIIVTLISRTGGAMAFAHHLTERLHSRRMVESASVTLSHTLFIDDYLSGLTVGYVMRPLTDKFAIPRAKLAFLVHSMTGPLTILAPISSWGAMIVGQLDQVGISTNNPLENLLINADPLFIYIASIPFIFYSLLIIASVWFIVRAHISYGPMKRLELSTQPLETHIKPQSELTAMNTQEEHSLAYLIIPLISLIGMTIIGFSYAGGFWLFGGQYGFFESFKHNTQTPFVLMSASLCASLISFTFALIRKKITYSELPTITIDGIKLMKDAIFMLILASTLGTMLKLDLKTGIYLGTLLHDSINITLLPCIFFLLATLIATATGGAWGTITIMVSIGIPTLLRILEVTTPTTPEHVSLLLPVLGAIFSGAVAGDHISPVSETTIMAATSTDSDPLVHAYTQFFYALPALIASAIGFLIAGQLYQQPVSIMLGTSLGTSFVLCLGLLWIINTISNRRKV